MTSTFPSRVGSILDYVTWRGDLSFASDPWNDMDSLIISLICYSNFGENERVFGNPQRLTLGDLYAFDILARYPQDPVFMGGKSRTELFELLSVSERFKKIRILDQVNDVDPERDIQFSAVTLEVPGMGIVIGFRGTSMNVTGWKEDFMMSYETPVPAQSSAVEYLQRVSAQTTGPMYLSGHSKGGNLAVYAASHVETEIQDRIQRICSFDGAGLDDGTMQSQEYLRIAEKIHSVIPSGSVVGLLMNYHPNYRVVESTTMSLLQHEPFSWLVRGKKFVFREKVSVRSQVLDQTLHEWLNYCSREQRETFVNTVFSLFEKKKRKRGGIGRKEDRLDESSRQMVLFLLYRLVYLQVENTFSVRVKMPYLQAIEALKTSLMKEEDKRIKSEAVLVDNHENGYADAVDEAMHMAALSNLNYKDSLRLQLFAEEMLSMIHAVTGDIEGTFWVEKEGNQFELHLTTRTVMDKKKREMLIASTTSRKNDAGNSFLGRLRDIFERAMVSDAENVIFTMTDNMSKGQGMNREWDRYEQSVLIRLADDVRIAIRGGMVSMTVIKVFADSSGVKANGHSGKHQGE